MQLLKPVEQSVKTGKEDTLRRLRIIELEQVTASKQQLLNELTDSFEKAMREQRAVAEQARMSHEAWCTVARREVETLEERKRQALLPMTERWAQVHSAEQELARRQAALAAAEESFVDAQQALMHRIDECSERELQLAEQLRAFERRQRGLRTQERSVQQQSVALSKKLEKFLADTTERETTLATRATYLESTETLLKARHEAQEAREAAQNERDRAINDRYQTLLRSEARRTKS